MMTLEMAILPMAFTLYIAHPNTPCLSPILFPAQVRVFDKDILTSDDDLGMVILPIASLQGKGQQELELPLQGKGIRARIEVTRGAMWGWPSCLWLRSRARGSRS